MSEPTMAEVLADAENAMEQAYHWIDSDDDIDQAADFICATAKLPIKWRWEEATPGCGVVFESCETA